MSPDSGLHAAPHQRDHKNHINFQESAIKASLKSMPPQGNRYQLRGPFTVAISSHSTWLSTGGRSMDGSTVHMILEATVVGVTATVSTGADSIPKSRQASRSAPADLLPVRFTWLPRADVNEPGTIGPRRCAGRPEDPRICPQVEPTGGRAPATPHGWGCCAVAAHGSEP